VVKETNRWGFAGVDGADSCGFLVKESRVHADENRKIMDQFYVDHEKSERTVGERAAHRSSFRRHRRTLPPGRWMKKKQRRKKKKTKKKSHAKNKSKPKAVP
jgi:hypothetical protein